MTPSWLLERDTMARATEFLSTMSTTAHRMGGSQAQRDLLYLTLMEAIPSSATAQLLA